MGRREKPWNRSKNKRTNEKTSINELGVFREDTFSKREQDAAKQERLETRTMELSEMKNVNTETQNLKKNLKMKSKNR